MKKKRTFIPSTPTNPIVLGKKIENLKKAIDALSKSHDIHISYLANFARHDIKNSIQSMDSILSTNDANEITDEHILSLRTNLKVIRKTIDNFSQLVPHSDDETFSLHSIVSALELLNRNILFEKKIFFIKELPIDVEVRFHLPFQAVLQMFNNLVINAIKCLEPVENPKLLLEVIISDFVEFYFHDNGSLISKNDLLKIFEYGFSTTGGSGIGLYHAKYLCELFNGGVKVIEGRKDEFTKAFLIYLPMKIIE